MFSKYNIRIKNQYEIEYVDEELLVNLTVDDLREPVPMLILGKCTDSKSLNELGKPTKEIQLVLYKRVAEFLKQQGYEKIYTEEFGEI